jgi:DNA mismatch endonuclease, patch repair protein
MAIHPSTQHRLNNARPLFTRYLPVSKIISDMERSLRNMLPNGQFVDVTPTHRKLMQSVRGKGNRTTEARVRAALVRAGLSGWTMNSTALRGHPDFFFPQERLAVFLDGCFWHGCKTCGHIPNKNSHFWKSKISRNRERDLTTTRYLRRRNIVVLRFWEHEITSSLQECVAKICNDVSRGVAKNDGHGDKRDVVNRLKPALT